jgi:hypothetical protein
MNSNAHIAEGTQKTKKNHVSIFFLRKPVDTEIQQKSESRERYKGTKGGAGKSGGTKRYDCLISILI